MNPLKANFDAVEARVAAACKRAGRSRDSVTVIAVSKLHPVQAIESAWKLGQRHFGENYAQELRDKHAELAHLKGIRWHAIGPLQARNAKYVARAAHVFHALESVEVAKELAKRRTGNPLEVLLEINLGNEESKAGLTVDEVPALANAVRALPMLTLVGLTGMPPLVEDAEKNRAHFKTLAVLARKMELPHLSMGTTADFEVAIEEGATMVRVGTALFGDRPVRPSAPPPPSHASLPHQLLLVVADAFESPGRGIIVVPDLQLDGNFPRRLAVELRRPDGSVTMADAWAEIPMVEPPGEQSTARHVLSFAQLAKEDVPPGTEVWLTDEKRS